MLSMNIIEAVTERDVDLLLLEEFNVSYDFVVWFYQKNLLPRPVPEVVKAFHSVSDVELGESDIIVEYKNGHAILVENKISAVAQPNQANRYFLRGDKGITMGLWDSFSTCIIAPENYLNTMSDVINYQKKISYEDIRDWFASFQTKRGTYRSFIMNEAIEQNRRGYTSIPDSKVSSFWHDYWIFASQNYPEIGMRMPGKKPSNSTFIYFYCESLPKRYQLIHKVEHGYVDIQIADMADNLDDFINLFTDEAVEIVAAGKSISFRKEVQKMNVNNPFKEQKAIADFALQQANHLVTLIPRINEKLYSES